MIKTVLKNEQAEWSERENKNAFSWKSIFILKNIFKKSETFKILGENEKIV